MKALALLFIAGLLAVTGADDRSKAEPQVDGDNQKTVRLGDITWNGVRYRDATARLRGTETIQIRSPQDGGAYIPWSEAPASVRQKFASEHKAAIEVAERNREAALAKWRQENGTFEFKGQVERIVATGTLFRQDATSKFFWFHGQWPNGKAGERVSFEAKASGTFKYTSPQGVASMLPVIVRAQVPGALKKAP